MSVLNEFSGDEQDLIVRLPFRVGIWISESDMSGGDESAAQEREALNTIVAAYAEDYLKSEFVQRVMEMTLARKDEWPKWTDRVDAVPDECDRVMKALATRVPLREVESFKHNLIDIGVAVAMAYREGITEPPEDAGAIANLVFSMKSFFGILFGGFKTATADENISAAEHRALVKLAGVLGVKSNILGSAA
jgi:hypothetical protein